MARKSSDEQPKAVTAARVISAKRRYFMSEAGISVDAATPEEASKKLAKLKQEAGNGK